MKNLLDKIKNHWIFFLITLLPIFDIITFFLIDSNFGVILTILRFLLAGIIFIYSFKPRTGRQGGWPIFFVKSEQEVFWYLIDKNMLNFI